MDYDIDPMNEFSSEGYDAAENATGFAGDELTEVQWAVMGCRAEAEEMTNENKTLRINVEMTLAPKGFEKDAATPGRRFWHSLWPSEKKGGQQMIDAFLLHAEVGVPTKRFSDEGCHENDHRPVIGAGLSEEAIKAGAKKAAQLEYAKMIAGALKGRMVVGHVGLEAGKVEKDAQGNVTRKFNDRNKLDGHYRVTDENLEAIRAGKYADGAVVKKTRTNPATKRKETYLAVKPSAVSGEASGSGGSGKTTASPEAPRSIGA